MSKWIVTTVIICISIFLTFMGLVFFDSNEKTNTSPKESANDIKEGLEMMRNSSDSYTGDEHFQQEDVDKSIQMQNDEPKEAGKFLIGALYLNDMDLFSQAFQPQKFMETLQQYKADKRQEKLQQLINTLTKNQSLESANISVVESTYGTDTENINIILYYKDETSVTIKNIPTTAVHTEHHSKSVAIYSLDIAPHKLLNKIEQDK